MQLTYEQLKEKYDAIVRALEEKGEFYCEPLERIALIDETCPDCGGGLGEFETVAGNEIDPPEYGLRCEECGYERH